MYEICKVGNEELFGEVILIEGNRATTQVYEEAGIQANTSCITTADEQCSRCCSNRSCFENGQAAVRRIRSWPDGDDLR